MNSIILMTATGAENLGDELITLCEIQQFRKQDKESNIILFSHHPSRTWRFFRSQKLSEKNLTILPYFPTHIRKHPIKNILYFLQTLLSFWKAQHIYIGGGGLLYSAGEEGHSPLRLWWMRAIAAKILRKPITYLSLGVSAKNKELQKYASGLFKNTTITVRDKQSQQRVLNLGYTAEIVPDPVFSYIIPDSSNTRTSQEYVIGIALRSGFIDDAIVATIIKKLLHKKYTVYLLPHSLHPDDHSSHDGYYLQRFLFPGVNITQTIEQTLATYRLCNCILGMRLHSIILASVMNIPLIAISYSAKTDAILTENHTPFFRAKEVTAEDVVGQVNRLFNH